MERKFVTARDILQQRARKPSLRQVRAVELYLGDNGGKSKREALLEAGYSQKMADNPERVFESRAASQLMEEMGVTTKTGIEILKRNTNAMMPAHFTFPPFIGTKDAKGTEVENNGSQLGEQMTDMEIREYLAGAGCVVAKIKRGNMARHVYGYTLNNKAQLATADMIFKLRGDYAPKKMEGKHDYRVGIFSMRELREKMREHDFKVTDPSK